MEKKNFSLHKIWIFLLLAAVLGVSAGTVFLEKNPSPKDSAAKKSEIVKLNAVKIENTEVENETIQQKEEEDIKEYVIMDFSGEPEHVIYFAGGCFWGIEHLMQAIPGVTDAKSGYANGYRAEDADYETVCAEDTGFRETVRVEFDPEEVSLDSLIHAYFLVIDPTVKNQQGYDIGPQYQTGVYYTNETVKEAVERIAEIERKRNHTFHVEIGPLLNFYPAEEYHQDYLDKNPGGYCHIPLEYMEMFSQRRLDPADFQKPSDTELKEMLTEEQYYVTQEKGTERAFENEYWDHFEKGIYVDIATGEPLFSSEDKYESSCGWPAFSKPIEVPSVIMLEDKDFGMDRIELRSRSGDTHLGHVFPYDTESPNGIRLCVNSAAIRFIPYEDMEKEGYGYMMDIFS